MWADWASFQHSVPTAALTCNTPALLCWAPTRATTSPGARLNGSVMQTNVCSDETTKTNFHFQQKPRFVPKRWKGQVHLLAVPPKSLKDAFVKKVLLQGKICLTTFSAPLFVYSSMLSFLSLTLPFLVHLLCEGRLFLIGKDQKWIW